MQLPDLKNKTIILVRHGEYRRNADDRKQVLTPLGQVQAESAGIWLKENHKVISVMWHSHVTRSIETASIIAKSYCRDITMKPSERLNEFRIDNGRIEVGG